MHTGKSKKKKRKKEAQAEKSDEKEWITFPNRLEQMQ